MRFTIRFFTRPCFLLATFFLSTFLMGCNGGGSSELPPTIPVAVIPTAETNPPTPIADASPTSEPIVIPTLPAQDVNFMGVSLSYDHTLFPTPPITELLPAQPLSNEGGNPETIWIHFTANSNTLSFREPQIFIYPVQNYSALLSEANNRITALRAFLVNPTAVAQSPFPFMPPTTTTPLFQAQLQSLNFQNGSGLRYLSQYTPANIGPDSAFYTYQGLTNDGQYYVAAFFPVSGNLFNGLSPDNATASLNAGAPADFSPNLQTLDAIVASLLVTPVGFPSPVQEIGAVFNGVSFSYTQAIATSLSSETIPAQRFNSDGGPGYLANVPEFVLFTLAHNGLAQRPSTLLVQPLKTSDGNYYPEYPDETRQIFEALSQRLATQEAAIGEIQTQFLTFTNGSGVRQVTFLPSALGIEPVSQQNVYYLFEGLTSDGRYYIRFTYGLASTLLPPDGSSLTPEQQQLFASDPPSYLAQALAPLSGVPTSAFTPDLAQLDQLIQSLDINETLLADSLLPSNPPDCVNNVAFVADVTIPDNTAVAANTAFDKTWRLRNTGTCTWTPDYQIVFSDGETFGTPDSYPFPTAVTPGSEYDLTLSLTAPATAGSYQGAWQLKNSSGDPFGDPIYVLITVP